MRAITRTLSFFSKWMAEVIRQPWLMVSLIFGPFLILFAFGQGVKLGVPKPRAIVVTQQSATNQGKIAPVPDELSGQINIIGTTTDLDEAKGSLEDGKADVVVVLPVDPLTAIQQGEHSRIDVYTNEIDPVAKIYYGIYLRGQVGDLNRTTVQKAIEDGQANIAQVRTISAEGRASIAAMRTTQTNTSATRQQVGVLRGLLTPLSSSSTGAGAAAAGAAFVIPGLQDRPQDAQRLQTSVNRLSNTVTSIDQRMASSPTGGGGPTPQELDQMDADLASIDGAAAALQQIPPEVLAAPFELHTANLARNIPNYISFYAPAVLALMLQHLAITLGALSMARIRLLGLMELLQTSPMRPAEAVTGNYLSYGTLCAIAGAALAALLLYGLKVPVYGSMPAFVGTLVLLVLTSLGIGFVISMLSSSEQQAAQVAMLTLIASVFFSGFIVSLDTIIQPVRALAFLLPATYAIRTLQDTMLRGAVLHPLDLAVLGAAAAVFFLLTVALFRREYRAR